MGNIIIDSNTAYISLPIDTALLYLKFDKPCSFTAESEKLFGVRTIAFNDKVKKGEPYFEPHVGPYAGERGGKIFFEISNSTFFRGKIRADAVPNLPIKKEKKYLGNLEDYLKDEKIGISDEGIQQVAQEIIKQIPLSYRENPYVRTEGIMSWIKDNIEYTILPKSLMREVSAGIGELPFQERTNVYRILVNSFNINKESLKEFSKNIHLPERLKTASNDEIAKKVMEEASARWGIFQLSWFGDECSAQKTLEEKAGKCVGISNLFVALSRSLGIPSRKLGGYIGNTINGGGHAWAASYLPPFGWLEVDPTCNQFSNFDYEEHRYSFSWNEGGFPAWAYFDKRKNSVAPERRDKALEIIDEALGFFIGNKSRLINLIQGKRYQKEIEFLQSLKSS